MYFPEGIIALAIVVPVTIIIALATTKTVKPNQTLIVVGIGATRKKTVTDRNGQERTIYLPTIKVATAEPKTFIVIPFLQSYRIIDLCVETIVTKGEEILTKNGMSVYIDWVAQIHPHAAAIENPKPIALTVLGRDPNEVKDIIGEILDTSIRVEVSNMTPLEVMVGKDRLAEEVQKFIGKALLELGYVVELSIGGITGEIVDQITTYANSLGGPKTEE